MVVPLLLKYNKNNLKCFKKIVFNGFCVIILLDTYSDFIKSFSYISNIMESINN